MKHLLALAVVFSVVPAALAQGYPQVYPPAKTTVEVDRSTLRQTELDFAKAFVSRNPARFAEFVAEDARFTSAGHVTEGKSAIVAEWTKMMQDPNLTLTWSPEIVETSEAGDLGYTSGPYEITVKRPDGTVGHGRGRFASVWRRQADGQYQIVFDIGSPEPPAQPKQ